MVRRRSPAAITMIVGIETPVAGSSVGVDVGVVVVIRGVDVAVLVGVAVAVAVLVGVAVAVLVGVAVAVLVGVAVGVPVGVAVAVPVGVGVAIENVRTEQAAVSKRGLVVVVVSDDWAAGWLSGALGALN